METKTVQCNCWIRHAVTPEHRKQVTQLLDRSRKIGDTTGIMLSLAQLAPCPAGQFDTQFPEY